MQTPIKQIGSNAQLLPYAAIQNKIDYLIGVVGSSKVLEILETVSSVESLYKLKKQSYGSNDALIDFIIATVCSSYQIGEKEKTKFFAIGRSQRMVDARTITIFLLRKYTPLTLDIIGKMFGGRSRACIRNSYEMSFKKLLGVKKVKMPLVARYEQIAKEVDVFLSITQKFEVNETKGGINEAA